MAIANSSKQTNLGTTRNQLQKQNNVPALHPPSHKFFTLHLKL